MERLRDLRLAAGLSQDALAKRADVTTGAVQCWEQGRRAPLLATAAKLARALGVSMDVLAGLEPLPKCEEQTAVQ